MKNIKYESRFKFPEDKSIPYRVYFFDILGGHLEAIYYQQLEYWSQKGKRKDGFIYKTKNEFEEETRLTRYQQDRIRMRLIKMGLLETKLLKANGKPTLHYRLKNTERVQKWLDDCIIPISKKLTIPLVRNLPLYNRDYNREYIIHNGVATSKEVTPTTIDIVKTLIKEEEKPLTFTNFVKKIHSEGKFGVSDETQDIIRYYIKKRLLLKLTNQPALKESQWSTVVFAIEGFEVDEVHELEPFQWYEIIDSFLSDESVISDFNILHLVEEGVITTHFYKKCY